MCAILAAVLVNVTIGVLFTWTFFVAPLETATGLTRATLSLAFSAATLAFATTMYAGVGVHAKYSTPAVAAGALLFGGLGLFIAGTFHAFPALLLGFGGMFGLCNGISYGIALSAANQMGSGKYAAVSKGVATGAAVGGYTMTPIFFGAPVKSLIGALGPHLALTTLGGVVAAVAVPVFLLYKIGTLQIAVPAPAGGGDDASAAKENELIRFLQVTTTTGAVAPLMCIAHAAGIYASFGGSAAAAVKVLSIMSITNWASRLVCGALCDQPNGARLGLRTSALTTSLALATLFFAGTAIGPAGTTVCLSVVAGGYGCLMTCLPVITSKLLGPSRFGTTYGQVFGLGWGIAGVSSAFIAGAIYDVTGTYLASCASASLLAATSASLAFRLPDEP